MIKTLFWLGNSIVDLYSESTYTPDITVYCFELIMVIKTHLPYTEKNFYLPHAGNINSDKT